MRRRDLLRSIGSSVVILTVASGTALATVEKQREAAIDHASAELGVAEEHLEVLVESVASWSTLGEDYYQAKVHDSKNNRMHRVLLDGDGNEVDRDQLHERERKKYLETYGKFTPEFKEELSNAKPDDTFEVEVRLKSGSIDRREPVKQAVENTNDNTPTNRRLKEKLSKVRKNVISNATKNLADKLVDFPETSDISPGTGTSTVTVNTTKSDLEKIANINEVWRISNIGDRGAVDSQASATRTINTSNDTGPLYNLDGVPLGMLETDHPSEYVEANIAGTRYNTGWDKHATETTECAASTDPERPGAAFNADVYFADNWPNDSADAFVSWFAENNVTAFNLSSSHDDAGCARDLTEADVTYEEAVFTHNVNYIGSAGNNGEEECDNHNVRSPKKTFNGIAVGSIDDNNSGGDRSDDGISDFACHVNPNSRNADNLTFPHQKPEVSAVGEQINTPYNSVQDDDSVEEQVQVIQETDGYDQANGTSYSAPNVTGVIAILDDEYGGIADAPDTAKAVTMAGANHDVGDYTRDRHGAGCVDVSQSLSVLFGGQFITDTFDESNNAQDYFIDLEAGDTVDIVLVWQSDVNQCNWENYGDAQSDINLLLNFYNTDNNLIGYDGENDRAWQFIEGEDDGISNDIDQTGSYGIKIWNSRWDADESYRNFTIAWRIY